MKKLIIICISYIFLLSNFYFTSANFKIETTLSQQKQQNYKKQVDSVYNIFENKIVNIKTEKQILKIENVIKKIENILEKKLSDKNNFILLYLKYLLIEKLDFLIDDKISDILNEDNYEDIKWCKKIEHLEWDVCVSNNKSCYIQGWIWEQVWNWGEWGLCSILKCDYWYDLINWVCSKKNEIINTNINNQIAVRKCYIQNWEWQETFFNNIWWGCDIISCNIWYQKLNNQCIVSIFSSVSEPENKININKVDAILDSNISPWTNNLLVYELNISTSNKDIELTSMSFDVNIIGNYDNNLFWTLYIDWKTIESKAVKWNKIIFDWKWTKISTKSSKIELLIFIGQSYKDWNFSFKLSSIKYNEDSKEKEIITELASSALFTLKQPEIIILKEWFNLDWVYKIKDLNQSYILIWFKLKVLDWDVDIKNLRFSWFWFENFYSFQLFTDRSFNSHNHPYDSTDTKNTVISFDNLGNFSLKKGEEIYVKVAAKPQTDINGKSFKMDFYVNDWSFRAPDGSIINFTWDDIISKERIITVEISE